MKNVFIFGASITHGVGSERGGWADKLKVAIHAELYDAKGPGEQCEVYELGVPGNTMADLVGRLEAELHARLMHNVPEDTCIVFMAGTNDSKAIGAPGRYDFTPEDFAASTRAFIQTAKEYASHVIGVGLVPVDESKTNPKHNPLNGKKSYFTNQRLRTFEQASRQACAAEGVQFVPLFSQVPDDWKTNYLYTDGIHPNNDGHLWIRSQVEPVVRAALGKLA